MAMSRVVALGAPTGASVRKPHPEGMAAVLE
jgi:hypothetical protein